MQDRIGLHARNKGFLADQLLVPLKFGVGVRVPSFTTRFASKM